MDSNQVDLTNCDKEPIHIPGRIQSHGFLIAVNQFTFTIDYISKNSSDFIGLDASALLGKPISELADYITLSDGNVELKQLLMLDGLKDSYEGLNPYQVKLGRESFYLIVSKSGGNYILEFEPATLEYDLQSTIGKSVSAILSGRKLVTMRSTI
ncbi:MAG: hypothetical protein EOO85_27375 [Pedobacter sp.]|nr:MAG: hypothetical protein EOO85_27375 [Pedobacter sp.]